MYKQRVIVKLLGRRRDSFVHPALQWSREQRGVLICPECVRLKREVYPKAIDVPIIQLPRGTSYAGVSEGGVGVIHEHLLEFLQSYLDGWVLGRCLRQDGSIIRDYSSIYCRETIVVRGDSAADYYICRTCGQISDGWGNHPYVLRREMPDRTVFQSGINELFISESLARELPWKGFRDLEPFPIEVLDEPLPDDPFPTEAATTAVGSRVTTPADTASKVCCEPEPDRYAELKAMTPDLPRLEDDSPKSCPVPMRKIISYLRLEGVDRQIGAKDLQFLRTARVGDHDCWIWRFEEQVCADAYVTVWRWPDNALCVGYRGNSRGLTPEQYIYGEHHKYF